MSQYSFECKEEADYYGERPEDTEPENWNKEEWSGWKIVSDMLDNPDENGIYRTGECYEKLYDFVCNQKQKAIASAKEEEREKWRLKNAGLYRQLFGEENRTYTSKELWEILDSYTPLFTEDQKKELKDNLNSIMKKS